MKDTAGLYGGKDGFGSHKKSYLILATRKSVLAKIQASMVADAIEKCHGIKVEILPMAVKGDGASAEESRRATGLFTGGLESALISGEADMAVHSMKDVPSTLNDEFCLPATLPRGVCWDGVVSKVPIHQIPSSIGVSSPRRKAQWKRFRPDLKQVEIYGNIDTRIRKYEKGACDALVLAGCGMDRINFKTYSLLNDKKNFLPAPCQGIIGIEILREREDLKELLKPINHEPTLLAMNAERQFVEIGGFSCQTPMGCLFEARGGKFHFSAELFKDHSNSTRVDLESDSDSLIKEAVEKIRG